jgi:hypothetical protein
MKLANLGYAQLKRFEDVEVADVPALFALAFRMIEDADLVAYLLARVRGKERIDLDVVGEALSLIQAGAPPDARPGEGALPFEEAPVQAFVNPGMVRDVARSPLPHDEQAAGVLAKYINFQLGNLLLAAARQSQRENGERLLPRHIALFSAELPWPFSRQ